MLREGIGLTNAAPRTTRGSGDLRSADFAGAAERLERLAAELEPARYTGRSREQVREFLGEFLEPLLTRAAVLAAAAPSEEVRV